MSNRFESAKKYRQSEKGKACTQRYNHSGKGKENQRRHQLTDRYQEKHLRLTYNLTLAEYDSLLENQSNVCAICGNINRGGARLCVDHDHITNEIRGLLCTRCNAVLGYMYDNPIYLRKAADYLEKRG